MNFNKKTMMLLCIIALVAIPRLIVASAALKPFASAPAPSLATEHDENIRKMYALVGKAELIEISLLQGYLEKLIQLHGQRLAMYRSKIDSAKDIERHVYEKAMEEQKKSITSVKLWQEICSLYQQQHNTMSTQSYLLAWEYNALIAYKLRSYKKLSLQAPAETKKSFSQALIQQLELNEQSCLQILTNGMEIATKDDSRKHVMLHAQMITQAVEKNDLPAIISSAHAIEVLSKTQNSTLLAKLLNDATPEAVEILLTFFAEYINKELTMHPSGDIITPFHAAIMFSKNPKEQIVKIFLDHGASLDIPYKSASGIQIAPLTLATDRNPHIEVITLIASRMKGLAKYKQSIGQAMRVANKFHPNNQAIKSVLSDAFIKQLELAPEQTSFTLSACAATAASPAAEEVLRSKSEENKNEKKAAKEERRKQAKELQKEAARLAKKRAATLPLVTREEDAAASGSGSIGSAEALVKEARLKNEAIQAKIDQDNAQAAQKKLLRKAQEKVAQEARRIALAPLKNAQAKETYDSSASAAAPAASSAAAQNKSIQLPPVQVDLSNVHGKKKLVALKKVASKVQKKPSGSSGSQSTASGLQQPVLGKNQKSEPAHAQPLIALLPIDTKHKKPGVQANPPQPALANPPLVKPAIGLPPAQQPFDPKI